MVIEEEEDEDSNSAYSGQENAVLENLDPSLVANAALLSKMGSSEGANYIRAGNDLIRQGKVAVVILAQEMEGFLSSDVNNKGFMDLQLSSGKTIYQILVEKFLRAQQVAHGSKKLTKQV